MVMQKRIRSAPEFSRSEHFLGTDFHQDDIRADLADLFPWDDIFLIRTDETAEPEWSWYHDSADTTVFGIQNQVADPSQPFAVTAVNHIFFL